jgi:lysozyme
MIMDIFSQLKRDEGFVPHIYRDQVGKRTIGYGHNLDAIPLAWINDLTVLTEQQADDILHFDEHTVVTHITATFSWFLALDPVRQGVIINMGFNMGVPRLSGFHNMIRAVADGNWVQAAAEMKDSAWYGQVGVRAVRLCKQMISGVWQ